MVRLCGNVFTSKPVLSNWQREEKKVKDNEG